MIYNAGTLKLCHYIFKARKMLFCLCLYLVSSVSKISYDRPGTSSLLGYGNTGARLSPLFGSDEISNFDDAIQDGGADVRSNKLGYRFRGSQLTGTERVGGSYGVDGLTRLDGGSNQISQPIGSYGVSVTRAGFDNGGGIRSDKGYGFGLRRAEGGLISGNGIYRNALTRLGGGLTTDRLGYNNALTRFGNDVNSATIRASGLNYGGISTRVGCFASYGTGLPRLGDISNTILPRVGGSSIGDNYGGVGVTRFVANTDKINNIGTYDSGINGFGFTRFGNWVNGAESNRVGSTVFGIGSSLTGFNTAENSQTGRVNNNKILSRSVLPTKGYTSNSADLGNKDISVIDSSTNDNGLMRFGLNISRNYHSNTPLSNSNSEFQGRGLGNSDALYRSTSLLNNIRQDVDGSSFMTNGVDKILSNWKLQNW